jgi:hypothetical protein
MNELGGHRARRAALAPGELLEGLQDRFIDVQSGAHVFKYASDAVMRMNQDNDPSNISGFIAETSSILKLREPLF